MALINIFTGRPASGIVNRVREVGVPVCPLSSKNTRFIS